MAPKPSLNAALIRDVDKLNRALAARSRQGVRFWHYLVSHSTFEFVVGPAIGPKNLVVCLTATTRLGGPVSWPNQRIAVRFYPEGGQYARYAVEDPIAGFVVWAESLSWATNYNLVKHESLYLPRLITPNS